MGVCTPHYFVTRLLGFRKLKKIEENPKEKTKEYYTPARQIATDVNGTPAAAAAAAAAVQQLQSNISTNQKSMEPRVMSKA